MPQVDDKMAELVERMARYSHESWSGWATWMFDKWDKTHSSGETFQERWRRQIATPYSKLNEAEKESARAEAREIIRVFGAGDLIAEIENLRRLLRKYTEEGEHATR
jgi:hypothetical protein